MISVPTSAWGAIASGVMSGLLAKVERACHYRVKVSDEQENLFPANVADGTDTSAGTGGFTATGGGAAVATQNLAPSWQGDRALKITTGGTSGGAYTDSVTGTAAARYMASVYLKAASGTRDVTVYLRDNAGGGAGNGPSVQVRILSTEWTRVAASHYASSGTPEWRLYILSADGNFDVYADGFQLVQSQVLPLVWAAGGKSAWTTNLNDLNGESWVLSAEVSDSFDQPTRTATVRLMRDTFYKSLAPDVDSQQNWNTVSQAAESLLVCRRRIWIEVQLRPFGYAVDPSGTWFRLFDGRITDIDLGGDDDPTITLTCRDLGTDLMDENFVEADRPLPTSDSNYANDWWRLLDLGTITPTWAGSPSSMDSEDLLLHMLNYLGVAPGATPLWVPSATGWSLYNPVFTGQALVTKRPLGELVRGIAQMRGLELRYKYRPATSAWELCLFEPVRDDAAVDLYLTDRSMWRLKNAKRSLANVRNRARVAFSDAGQERVAVTVEDATSLAAYGKRWSEICEASSSGIRDSTEATALATALITDYKEPSLEATIDLPLFPLAEVNDMYTISGGSRAWSEDPKDFSVVGLRHDLGKGRTELMLRETDGAGNRPAAGWSRAVPRPLWLGKEARPGVQPIPSQTRDLDALFSAVWSRVIGDKQAISTGTKTILTIAASGKGGAHLDRANAFNTSNGKWTAQISGLYFIQATVKLTSVNAGTQMQVFIAVDGTDRAVASRVADSTADLSVTAVATLVIAAGSYIEVKVQHDHGSSRDTSYTNANDTALVVRRIA